jgi:DNA-binding response OmpR family regulator
MALAAGPAVLETDGLRVLVIDDDPVVRDAVRALLEYFGYECGVAADGPSGLALFESATWDVVITDLTVSGRTGWHIVDAIRKRVSQQPVIVMSGADHLSLRTVAGQCRVSLLVKPFGLNALKAALVDALYARLRSGGPPALLDAMPGRADARNLGGRVGA